MQPRSCLTFLLALLLALNATSAPTPFMQFDDDKGSNFLSPKKPSEIDIKFQKWRDLVNTWFVESGLEAHIVEPSTKSMKVFLVNDCAEVFLALSEKKLVYSELWNLIAKINVYTHTLNREFLIKNIEEGAKHVLSYITRPEVAEHVATEAKKIVKAQYSGYASDLPVLAYSIAEKLVHLKAVKSQDVPTIAQNVEDELKVMLEPITIPVDDFMNDRFMKTVQSLLMRDAQAWSSMEYLLQLQGKSLEKELKVMHEKWIHSPWFSNKFMKELDEEQEKSPFKSRLFLRIWLDIKRYEYFIEYNQEADKIITAFIDKFRDRGAETLVALGRVNRIKIDILSKISEHLDVFMDEDRVWEELVESK